MGIEEEVDKKLELAFSKEGKLDYTFETENARVNSELFFGDEEEYRQRLEELKEEERKGDMISIAQNKYVSVGNFGYIVYAEI